MNTQKIKEAFESILSLPYSSSYDFERDVFNHLCEKLDLVENKSAWLQPNGSQSSPDIFIQINDKRLSIELKTSLGESPMWNGGIPKRDCLYIFSSKKHNKTTLAFGEDIISENDSVRLNEFKEEVKALYHKYKGEIDKETDTWTVGYLRAMFSEKRGHCKWILREDRGVREKRAVKKICDLFS